MDGFFVYETNLGKVAIGAKASKIVLLKLIEDDATFTDTLLETVETKEAFTQLVEYLAGERQNFNLSLAPKGTEFQEKVWQALLNIPYGKTKTYGEIALEIGSPKACRGVGQANNKNPIAIIIPCHRVIGANGSLVGYAHGLSLKKQLLDLEAENCTGN